MSLPRHVTGALETLLHGVSRTDLAQRAASLSRSYRSGGASPDAIVSFPDALAYAVTRMPATFAGISAALAYTAGQLPDWRPSSLLDLGAGPGTAAFAAVDLWPDIRHVTMVERNATSRSLARKLAEGAPMPALSGARIIAGNLPAGAAHLPDADLVVAAYVLVELHEAEVVPMVRAALSKARQALVLVEPGTPAGFERIRMARTALIGLGARPVAPCPHSHACPIIAPDWCHFSVRLSRSRDHRLAKQAERSFEDEKFSYLAVSRTLVPAIPGPRIISPPRIGKADVTLRVCDAPGVAERRISRQDKLNYKAAKKLGWGDIVRDTDGQTPELETP
ncbi:MAG: small ribosomal subunit Rsm22 family protein [Hyphomicrobiaceae bacterium]